VTTRDSAYRRLAAELAEGIQGGQFDGRQLPTEHHLVLERGLSRGTVRRAMQELVGAGLVDRSPGRGTFVTRSGGGTYARYSGSIDDVLASSVDTDSEVLQPLQRRIDLDAAGHLRLNGDSVGVVRIRRFLGETPFTVTTIAMPLDIAEQLMGVPEVSEVGLCTTATVIGLMESRLGLRIGDAWQTITAEACPADVAAELTCAVGGPVLRIDRLYSDATGRRVEYARGFYDPAQYSNRISLRRGQSAWSLDS